MRRINHYINFRSNILRKIARDRDIDLVGCRTDKAQQLHLYDEVLQIDWLAQIRNKTFENFHELVGIKLILYGIIHNVDFDYVPDMNHRNLVDYIKISILLREISLEQPSSVSQNLLGHFSELVIQKIETLNSLLPKVDRSLLEIFSNNINYEELNLKLLNNEDLCQSIILNGFQHIDRPKYKNLETRYNLLIHNKYSHLLQTLYQISSEPEQWVKISYLTPHPLESTIMDLDRIKEIDLIETLGMVIPSSYYGRVKDYIIENIVSYEHVVTRKNVSYIPINNFSLYSRKALYDYITSLTDTEIFRYLGIYIKYSSRRELVEKIFDCIDTPQFMYLTCKQPIRCYSEYTPSGSHIYDTNFLIGYGTIEKYHIYELSDLYGAFHINEETGAMIFRKPENIKTSFSIADIEMLRDILICFRDPGQDEINSLTLAFNSFSLEPKSPSTYTNPLTRPTSLTLNIVDNSSASLTLAELDSTLPSVASHFSSKVLKQDCQEEQQIVSQAEHLAPETKESSLVEIDPSDPTVIVDHSGKFDYFSEIKDLVLRIDQGLNEHKDKLEYDNIARYRLTIFDTDTQIVIRNFLYQLIYIGMYMRRWQGPGHPYPLNEESTKKDINPEEAVIKALVIANEMLDNMGQYAKDYCFDLRVCEYNSEGIITNGYYKLLDEWNEINAAIKCIRMSSNKLVGTGFHYLRVLFHETVPNIDTKTIDKIY